MNGGRRVEIRSHKRLFDDFFKIDELVLAHERYDGGMSGDERRWCSSAAMLSRCCCSMPGRERSCWSSNLGRQH